MAKYWAVFKTQLLNNLAYTGDLGIGQHCDYPLYVDFCAVVARNLQRPWAAVRLPG